MNKYFFFLSFFLICFSATAQEFGSAEGFYIGNREIRPSLSYLAPEVPSQNLTLREVDFSKKEKREVDFVAMMEKKRYEIQSSYVELDSPVPTIGKGEKSLIQITNEFRMNDRSSNYDLYTGKKLIPAYTEMKPGLFNGVYSPYSGRSFLSPYSY